MSQLDACPIAKDATAAVAASRSIFVIRLMTNLNGESQTLIFCLSLSLSVAAWVANLVTDICNILHVAFEQSRPRATHVALDEVAAVAAALSSLSLPPLTRTLTLTGSGTLSRSVGLPLPLGLSVSRCAFVVVVVVVVGYRFTCRIFHARDSVCGRLRASAVCFCLLPRSLASPWLTVNARDIRYSEIITTDFWSVGARLCV